MAVSVCALVLLLDSSPAFVTFIAGEKPRMRFFSCFFFLFVLFFFVFFPHGFVFLETRLGYRSLFLEAFPEVVHTWEAIVQIHCIFLRSVEAVCTY